jgi:hypothetical protein
MAWQAAPAASDWLRRHPYLAAALALHGLGLALLWAAGPYQLARQQAVRDEALIAKSLQQAHAMQAQRRVRALEAAQRAMTGEGPAADAPLPDDLPALAERAQAAARAVQAADQAARAEELARLRQRPREQALAEVRAQDAQAAAASSPTAPADALAQAERQTQAALARQAARDARAAHGTTVQLGGPGGTPRGAGARGGLSDGSSGGSEGDERLAGGSGSGTGAGAPGVAGGALERGRQPATVRAHDPAAPVAAAATGAVHHLARGRRLGAGGALADRVLLDAWYVLGPFDSPAGRAGQLRVEPPELGVNLDAVYAGAGGRALRWRFVQEPAYPLVPHPRRENATYYATTEVHSPDDREVWLDIGADDDSRLWLNDQLVWDSGPGDKPWYHRPFYTLGPALRHAGLAEGSVRVRLRPGPNRLLFKLVNGIDLMFFSVTLRP